MSNQLRQGSVVPPALGSFRVIGRRGALVLLLATIAVVVRDLVEVFGSTRAAPPEEFPASAVLFAFYDTAVIALYVAAVAFIAGMLHALWQQRRASQDDLSAGSRAVVPVALVGASVGMASTLWWGRGLLVAGGGLFVAFLVLETRYLRHVSGARRIEEGARVLAETPPRRFAAAASELLGLPILAFVSAVLVEVLVYTRRFAGTLFGWDDYWRFVGVASSAAVVTGARFGLELGAMVLLARAMTRGLAPGESGRRGVAANLPLVVLAAAVFSLVTSATWSPIVVGALTVLVVVVRIWLEQPRGLHPALVLPVLTGLYVWARLRDFLMATLGHEVHMLQLGWMVDSLFGLLAILVATSTHRGLTALAEARPPRGPFDVVSHLAVSVMSPFTPSRARRSGAREEAGSGGRSSAVPFPTQVFVPAVIILLLALAGLVEVNYPHFMDFAQRIQNLWSMLIGLVTFLLVLITYAWSGRRVLHRPWARVAVVGALLVAGIGWAWGRGLQVPRMIAEQHSQIAKRILAMAELIPDHSRIDLSPEAAPANADRELWVRAAAYPDPGVAFPYSTRRPPIFMLVWDAARADHLGTYGYHRATTPSLDRLAADGVLFERVYANGTATTTSLRHIFTGKYSSRYMLDRTHGPFFTGPLVADGYDRIFVNILGTDFNGVSRDAFVRNHADPAPVEAATVEFRNYAVPEKMKEAVRLLDEALAGHAGRAYPGDGIFMFLHLTPPHWPWRNYDDHPIYGTDPVDRYDNAIGHADHGLGVLLDALVDRGLYEDAIIIVTADHGTGLGERGTLGGFQPYEEQVRVPLVIKAPGFSPRRVSHPVAGIDLAPTVVSLFHPGAPDPYDGFSLIGLMAGTETSLPRRYIYSLNSFEDTTMVWDLATGLKLHHHGLNRYEMLFDMNADPAERYNLADERPDLLRPMLELVRAWLWQGRYSWGNPFNYRPVVGEGLSAVAP